MKRAIALLGLLVVGVGTVGVVGCNSGDCPSGAYRDEKNEYCMVLPSGWAYADSTNDGDEVRHRFVKGSKDEPKAVLEVTTRAASELENRIKFMKMQNTVDFIQVKQQQDLPNGGYWFVNHNKSVGNDSSMSFVKGKTKMAECMGGWNDNEAPEIADACKSLRGIAK